MKGILAGLAVIGVGGAAVFGTGGHDYSRVIHRPPNEVYAAFSAVAPEGQRTENMPGSATERFTGRVVKDSLKSIRFQFLIGSASVTDVTLGFEPADDGKSTLVNGDIDVDQQRIADAIHDEQAVKIAMVPDKIFELGFGRMMDDAAQRVEAHQSLPPFHIADQWQSGNQGNSRWEREEAQRQAAAPTTSAAPMVDPNQAARDYLNQKPGQPAQ
jgi:hypothetical protein